jgi:hypothetical protein
MPGCSAYDISHSNPPAISPIFPEESLGGKNTWQQFNPSPLSLFNPMGNEDSHEAGLEPVPEYGHLSSKENRVDSTSAPHCRTEGLSDFSHQISGKLMSRTDSPMLAPDPISPARQLILKNSIPQFMKALPPLPLDQLIMAVSQPIQSGSFDATLPSHLSPSTSEVNSTYGQELPRAVPPHEPSEPNKGIQTKSRPVELISTPPRAVLVEHEVGRVSGTPPLPPKLKLKLRNSTGLSSKSPRFSSPWDLEESYPWSKQDLDVGLAAISQEENCSSPNPPKFKLKITRASNSTVGTVRVNRESVDAKSETASQFRNPKDLFTPSSGIDNIFRQVGKHLLLRKASTGSRHSSVDGKQAQISTPVSGQLLENTPPSLESNISQPSVTPANNISHSEVRSFFSDDSSGVRGKHSLRKRLSNLRARVAVPYPSRNGAHCYDGAHSYDDLNWRDRNDTQTPTISAPRSVNNLHAIRTCTDGGRMRRFAHRIHKHRLRERFSLWLQEARLAIVARMKPRHAGGGGGDDGGHV